MTHPFFEPVVLFWKRKAIQSSNIFFYCLSMDEAEFTSARSSMRQHQGNIPSFHRSFFAFGVAFRIGVVFFGPWPIIFSFGGSRQLICLRLVIYCCEFFASWILLGGALQCWKLFFLSNFFASLRPEDL